MMTIKADPEIEQLAREQVARDARRKNKSLRTVFVELWRYPSPYLLSLGLVVSVTGRVIVGGGSLWELTIPVILLALLPFIEWTVHVGILHWRPRRVGAVRIDPLLSRKHREHHAAPRAVERAFLPWQSGLAMLPFVAVVSWLVTPTWSAMFTMMISVYVLLSAYEWTHYLLHSDYRPRSRWYRMVWRNHRLHHYKSEHYWFAVTTAGTADRLFGTYPDPADVPTSPTVKRLHADEAGSAETPAA